MQFIAFFSLSLSLAAAIETNGQRQYRRRAGSKSGKGSNAENESREVTNLSASLPLAAPFCTGIGESCSSGNILLGVGDSELRTNLPGTSINGCRDGNSGELLVDESVERITVSAVEDGQVLQSGKMARIDALVHAFACSNFPCDFAHFYSTNDINFPTWNFLGTRGPDASGLQTLSVQFVLPQGGIQAVRVAFGFLNAQGPCVFNAFTDHDDLIFSVAAGDPDEMTAEMAAISAQVDAISAQGADASTDPRDCVSYGPRPCIINPICQWNSGNDSCERLIITEETEE